MKKPILSFILPLLYLSLLMGCATTPIKMESDPNPNFVARRFPEVELRTVRGESCLGKLIKFENQTLIFLPFPYWNVDSINVSLDEIDTIKMSAQRSVGGRAFLAGFGISFFLGGIVLGAASKYDEDYQLALAASAVGAVAAGAVAGLVGLAADVARRSRYEFQTMTYAEKIQTLRSIMGSRY